MSNRKSSVLIRQAILVPIGMLAPVVVGFFATDYSSLSQHMSELQARENGIAWAVRIGAILAGSSICLFALGCWRAHARFTALTSFLFGLAMICNGVFIFGDPRHGLYGLAIMLVLVPAFFLAEQDRTPSV